MINQITTLLQKNEFTTKIEQNNEELDECLKMIRQNDILIVNLQNLIFIWKYTMNLLLVDSEIMGQ